MLLSDGKRYKQILYNFIGNALKFTNEGFILIKVLKEDDLLVTKVIDSGIGIQPENMQKLFKNFGKL